MFLCAPCRRRLLGHTTASLGKSSQQGKAQYSKQADPAPFKPSRKRRLLADKSPQPSDNTHRQAVEEDFLQRLFQSRHPDQSLGPYSQLLGASSREIPSVDGHTRSGPLVDGDAKPSQSSSSSVAATEELPTARSDNGHASRGDGLFEIRRRPAKSAAGTLLAELAESPAMEAEQDGESLHSTNGQPGLRQIYRGAIPEDGSSPKPEHAAASKKLAAAKASLRIDRSSDKTNSIDPAQAESSSTVSTASDMQMKAFEELETALSRSDPITYELYDRFAQVCSTEMPFTLRQQFLERAVTSWCNDPASSASPKPSWIFSRLAPKMKLVWTAWLESVWSVLRSATLHIRSKSNEQDSHLVGVLCQELTDLWRRFLLSTVCTVSNTRGSQKKMRVKEWRALTDSTTMKDIREWSPKSLIHRLWTFFAVENKSHFAGIDTALLTTYVLLRNDHSRVAKATDFPDLELFVSSLMVGLNERERWDGHNKTLASRQFQTEDINFLVKKIEEAGTFAASNYAEYRSKSLTFADSSATQSSAQRAAVVEMFLKRIGRAYENQSRARLDGLWQEAQSYFLGPCSGETNAKIPPLVYGQFLTGYMAVRAPNQAIDIWNHMIKSEVAPTVAAWTAVMQGLSVAKDPSGLESTWTNMLDSGVQPDVQAWATRIYGLGATGYWKAGIQAFEQMTANWVEALQKANGGKLDIDYSQSHDVESVPKPNIETVNGLVDRLARGKHHQELGLVLSRAKSIGIVPDVGTYNILMRTALVQDKAEVAGKLLRQMQDAGVQPDVATFTMIIGSHLNANPGEQVADTSQTSTLRRILDEMENAGIKANTQTFSTIVNGLLNNASPASNPVEVAETVFRHMENKGIPRSPHVYTQLVMYLFSREPPNLPAVEATWTRARLDQSFSYLDTLFYERLIEGFARNTDITRMNKVLLEAAKIGRTPGWPAMAEVVQALARVGEWDRAYEMVDGIRRQEQAASDSPRKRTGSRHFWNTVARLGIPVGDGPARTAAGTEPDTVDDAEEPSTVDGSRRVAATPA